jgi:hypothetical protein
VDPAGSGQGLLAGCCERGDEPSGSGATESVSSLDGVPNHYKAPLELQPAVLVV